MGKSRFLGLVMTGMLVCIGSIGLARADDASGPSPIQSSGGHYFSHRLVLPVPAFAQDDPRWSRDLLGPTTDTLGEEGCTLTSIVMVLNFYGIRTDPSALNRYLTTHDGYDGEGYLDFDQINPATSGKVRLAFAGAASYRALDRNLLAGHPVIVQMTLPNGAFHFVVVVGKEGWNYLVRNPAADPGDPVSQLAEISPRIDRQFLFLKTP